MVQEIDVNNLNFAIDINNFDPNNIQSEETCNFVFILDLSPSMNQNNAIGELTNAYNAFIEEMKKSHYGDRILVCNIGFSSQVDMLNPFQPINSIPTMNFKTLNGLTALYDAVKVGLENAIEYRKRLETTGILCKTLLFVITDGYDNESTTNPSEVKSIINNILKDEKNMFTFTTMMFGIGEKSTFQKAQEDMGIQYLATIGNSAAEIRKMIAFISSSVSSTASGQGIQNMNF